MQQEHDYTTSARIPVALTPQPAVQNPVIPDLTEGRMVHYVLPAGPHKGQHRPAVIVKVWDQLRQSGRVNMTVFTDYDNDVDVRDLQAACYDKGIVWVTSVPHSEGKEPGTWHFIEPA